MGNTKTSSVRKKTTAVPSGAGFCCYVGPSILGVVQQNQLFSGTVAATKKSLADAIEKRPEIAGLIVDGNNLADALIEVRNPGTLLYKKYHKITGNR